MRKRMPILCRCSSPQEWICISWQSAARSWDGAGRLSGPLTERKRWKRYIRTCRLRAKCAVWYDSGWSMRIIFNLPSMGNCCCTSIMNAVGRCPLDMLLSICLGCWNGIRQPGNTVRHMNCFWIFLLNCL